MLRTPIALSLWFCIPERLSTNISIYQCRISLFINDSWYRYICICITFTSLLLVLSETSRRRQKTIKLRGTCAYLLYSWNFFCCWSSSNNFLAVSLSPFYFIFFFLCIARPVQLPYLSFFYFLSSYEENYLLPLQEYWGWKCPKISRLQIVFSVCSLLPLVIPLVEF